MFTEAEFQKARFALFLPRPALLADQSGVHTLSELREALAVSQYALANRLGVSPQALKQLEATHDPFVKVREYAKALDCDVELTFKPRRYETFAEHFWRPAANEAIRTAPRSLTNALPARRLLYITGKINELIDDPKFRRDQGWSRHRQIRKPYFEFLNSKQERPVASHRISERYFSPTT